MRKVIITDYNNKILYMLITDNRTTDIILFDHKDEVILNNIYVARVKDVVKNINAAFVEIRPDTICFLDITEKNHIFLNKKNNTKICQGDLLLVQVKNEAVKSKAPTVSSGLSITGKYSVFDASKSGTVGISRKISDKKRADELKKLVLPYVTDKYGFIIRTEAENAPDDEIISEIVSLASEYSDMIKKASSRPRYTLIRQSENPIHKEIASLSLSSEEEVVTDMPDIYEELIKTGINARIYNDKLITIDKLYSIDTRINEALSHKVYLKNGGFLIIEPTEALTVIDVNSGKFEGSHVVSEDAYYRINTEAAKEIARQIRLRNISGIIIIDFINMKDKEHIKLLTDEVQKLLKLDTVEAHYIDITSLGLMEITRKKVRRPLYESIKQ